MGWFKRLFSTPKLEMPEHQRGAHAEPRAAKHAKPPTRVVPARREPDWRSYDWEDVAEVYASVLSPMTTQPYRDLLALAGRSDASQSLLDIGTGTGEELAGLEGPAVGIDASQHMLTEGRARAPRVRVAAADLIDLPFRAGAFDIVTANFVLPEVTKLDTALFDMIRVLKPGGVLGISVWTEVLDELTRTWRDLATEKLGPELMRDAFKQGVPWMERLADPKHVEQTLRDAGLRPVRVERRRYRNELTREDYVRGKQVEVVGRYLHRMLGPERWAVFGETARERFAQRFGDRIVDFRDVILAVGTKPRT